MPAPLQPRDLPSLDRLLHLPALSGLLDREPRDLVVDSARQVLDTARAGLRNGGWPHALADLPALVEQELRQVTRLPLRPVINATGIIVHTNLGRAPLSEAAMLAVRLAAEGYSNLEYDLEAGERGSRHNLVVGLLRRLTGAEDALVVNNNAAAMLLILSSLAQGKEVVISRGQLVEIGGGVRIPDILRQSGAVLVEVGTTNRTYAADFESAIQTDATALLLRVHSSNFLQVGFTASPSLEEMVRLAEQRQVPVVDDLGSGTLLDTSQFGLAREPTVQDSVAAGAALIAFSGDKLLGGPQAGIIIGRPALVARLKRHPLLRAVRPDKLTLAALSATLVHYLRGEAERTIPVWRMLATSVNQLEQRGAVLMSAIGEQRARIVPTQAAVGGGALPGQTLDSRAVALSAPSAQRLAAALRTVEAPVVGRIEQQQVLLDLRTVLPEQDAVLTASVQQAFSKAEA